MATLFQIDKSGGDIFEKDYSVVVVVNGNVVYGVNIPKRVKDEMVYLFRCGKLGINGKSEKRSKNRFRLRFHTAVVIKVVERVVSDLGCLGDVGFQVCNDFDGHFHEIKDMLFGNLSSVIPSLRSENILQAKFVKPCLIDDAGKAFRNRDKEMLRGFVCVDLKVEDVFEIVRK